MTGNNNQAWAIDGRTGRPIWSYRRRLPAGFSSSVCCGPVNRGFGILGHDCIGMMRAVIVDMRDRLIDAIDDPRCDDRVFIFGIPVLIGGGLYPGVHALHGVIAAHFAAGVDQHRHQWCERRGCTLAVDQ